MCFIRLAPSLMFLFFFFNDTATTEIYTLSLHDALPISDRRPRGYRHGSAETRRPGRGADRLADHRHAEGAARATTGVVRDRKSTRLNSSHSQISYAVFCLKKKTNSLSVFSYPLTELHRS